MHPLRLSAAALSDESGRGPARGLDHTGTAGRLRFSLPGEFVDHRGVSRPRPVVRRIAVIKPDHIGDLLIAARAFWLLRHFFPSASIDLLCGPWNIGLARRLGIFDNVIGIDLFHEISDQQNDAAQAAAARRAGIVQLQALGLGPYDVAIDLRYDRDSRPALKALDATIYAGFGQRHEFPFLDVAIPIQEPGGPSHAQTGTIIPGSRFHREATLGPVFAADVDAGRIRADRGAIDLNIVVTGAKSPAECGILADDIRQLGVGLERIRATPVANG